MSESAKSWSRDFKSGNFFSSPFYRQQSVELKPHLILDTVNIGLFENLTILRVRYSNLEILGELFQRRHPIKIFVDDYLTWLMFNHDAVRFMVVDKDDWILKEINKIQKNIQSPYDFVVSRIRRMVENDPDDRHRSLANLDLFLAILLHRLNNATRRMRTKPTYRLITERPYSRIKNFLIDSSKYQIAPIPSPITNTLYYQEVITPNEIEKFLKSELNNYTYYKELLIENNNCRVAKLIYGKDPKTNYIISEYFNALYRFNIPHNRYLIPPNELIIL